MEKALAALPGVTRAEAAAAARAPLEFNATLHARGRHARRRSLLLRLRVAPRRAAHVAAGRRRGGVVQSRRPGGRLRAQLQPVRRGRRVGARARAHGRRQRRSSSTASSIGSTRRRSTAAATSGATGGARIPRGSRSCSSTSARCRSTPSPTIIPYRPALEVTDYPKAGDPNPLVRARHRARGRRRRGVGRRQPPTPGSETLIVEVSWTPDSRHVEHQVQNREQTWLDMNLADAATGRHADAAARDDQGVGEQQRRPRLAEGRLVPLVQRAHRLQAPLSLSRQRRGPGDAGRRRHVGTLGRAPVPRRGRGAGARLFLVARAERAGPAGVPHRARRRRTARGCRRRGGTHQATFNPAFTRYVDRWSDVTTPTQVRLHAADGTRGARDRRQPGAGAHRVPPVAAGVRAGEDARRRLDGRAC